MKRLIVALALAFAPATTAFAQDAHGDNAEVVSVPADDAVLAQAIDARRCLNDPQELRPIPLSGIPGWHPEHGRADFFERLPCFRPKRAGKTYPEPLRMR